MNAFRAQTAAMTSDWVLQDYLVGVRAERREFLRDRAYASFAQF